MNLLHTQQTIERKQYRKLNHGHNLYLNSLAGYKHYSSSLLPFYGIPSLLQQPAKLPIPVSRRNPAETIVKQDTEQRNKNTETYSSNVHKSQPVAQQKSRAINTGSA